MNGATMNCKRTYLVLEEFFSSIHIFSSYQFLPVFCQDRLINIVKDAIKKNLKNTDLCFPIIAGLEGLESSSNRILKLFVEKIKTGKTNASTGDRTRQQMENMIDLFENGCDLPEKTWNFILSNCLSFQFKINNNYKQKLVFFIHAESY